MSIVEMRKAGVDVTVTSIENNLFICATVRNVI